MRTISSQADLDEGCAHLALICPVWARILPEIGPLPLRRRPDGFAAILNAVIGQQVSTQAAAAIAARLEMAGLNTAPALLAASDDDLRACGLSRPKIGYLRAIAATQPDWAGLRAMTDDQVTTTLTALPGIGPWTAEIYLQFALGRPDVLASGDLALQEAARIAYDLPERPRPAQLVALAEPWRPWRAVAARGLWAYYRLVKGREGIR